MSKFSRRNITGSFSFDGDTVTVQAQRLKQQDMAELAGFLDYAAKQAEALGPEERAKGTVTLSVRDMFGSDQGFMNAARDVLPRRVTQLTGLTDEEGQPLTLEDIIEEVYFMPLLSEVLGWLVSSSFIEPTEGKASPGQPAASSGASAPGPGTSAG